MWEYLLQVFTETSHCSLQISLVILGFLYVFGHGIHIIITYLCLYVLFSSWEEDHVWLNNLMTQVISVPKVRNLKSFKNSKKPGHTLRLAQYLSVAVSGEPEALVTEARVPLVS